MHRGAGPDLVARAMLFRLEVVKLYCDFTCHIHDTVHVLLHNNNIHSAAAISVQATSTTPLRDTHTMSPVSKALSGAVGRRGCLTPHALCSLAQSCAIHNAPCRPSKERGVGRRCCPHALCSRARWRRGGVGRSQTRHDDEQSAERWIPPLAK